MRKEIFVAMLIGHDFASCPCKQGRDFGNNGINESGESVRSSDSETMAVAAEVISTDDSQNYMV